MYIYINLNQGCGFKGVDYVSLYVQLFQMMFFVEFSVCEDNICLGLSTRMFYFTLFLPLIFSLSFSPSQVDEM